MSPALTTNKMPFNKSTRVTASGQKTFWSGRPNFARPSACRTGLTTTYFEEYNGRRVRMPTVLSRNLGHRESKPFLYLIIYKVRFSILGRSQVRRKEAPRWTRTRSTRLGGPMREIDCCLREALRAEHHKINHTKMTPDQDPDEFLYIMNSCRDRLNMSTPPEGPINR